MNKNNIKKLNEKNAYLIGSKPETMKMDIILFKEEVLVELKNLNNSLAEKYRKTNQEVKDKLELFDKKLNDFNIKLSDLSTKIITDIKFQEKLSELLIFKDKAQDIMTSNRIKLTFLTDETHESIDKIYSLLKESILYPGVIGNKCKFKNFHEYIDYTLLQIAIMLNFKEKNIMDLSTYKSRIETSFNSMKLQLDNDMSAINYYINENNKKMENKMGLELEMRDEKIKNLKIENYEYITKLNKEVQLFLDEFNLIQKIKTDIEQELKNVKKNNIQYINDKFKIYKEMYHKIENQVRELNSNIKTTVNYLNREDGANIKLMQNEEYLSPLSESISLEKNGKSFIFRNNSNFDIISKNIYDIKNIGSQKNLYFNNKEGLKERIIESAKERMKNKAGQLEENKTQKEKPKSSKRYKSDIMKYIKGEIKAEEIGSLTKYHHHQNHINNNDTEIHKIKDNQNEIKKIKTKTYITKNKHELIYNINKALDDSFENKKDEKAEKKMTKNRSNYNYNYKYRNIVGKLNDIDVQLNKENNISNTFEFKNLRTIEDINNSPKKSKDKKSDNFKKELDNIDINPKKSNDNPNKNHLRKNLSLVSSEKSEKIENINILPKRNKNNGSYKNIFKYNTNNNSLMNLFLPLRNKNQIDFYDKYNLNMFNIHKTIDNKIFKSPKLKINKKLNNLFPIEITNNDNNKFHNIISLTSFNNNKNKNRLLSNIKYLFDNKTFYS